MRLKIDGTGRGAGATSGAPSTAISVEVGASVAVLASATLTDSRMAGRNFGSGGALETVVGVYAAIAAAVARLRKTAPARLQSARRNASLSL